MKLKLFNQYTRALILGLMFSVHAVINQAVAQNNDLIDIMDKELNREFEVLSNADNPVYYMDYQVREVKRLSVLASLGSLINSSNTHNRSASANVRIGDYQLDHSHPSKQLYNQGFGSSVELPISLDNNEKAISHIFWTLTNLKYQEAENKFERISTSTEPETVADFSKEKPEVFIDELNKQNLSDNQISIEFQLKRLSSIFLENEDIIVGEIGLNKELVTKYFVSSEGSKVAHQIEYNFINVSCQIRDPKGVMIPLYQTYFANNAKDLPDENILETDIRKMMSLLVELQKAPLAEPYSGPAILHPRATGVFFHEIFGHRIEGSRLKNDFDSQTFKEKIGEPVLPKSINVYMDPTIDNLDGQDLIGHYLFDDEGVRGQRVNVVDQGILKGFLMTRKPIKHFNASNGHARTQGGFAPISRQSNLIVESSKSVSKEDLRKQLIKECKKQQKSYGYYFRDVQGGFTNTDRFSPNAFNITPTLVYRVYVDGRPDELVRGVNLIGTPLSMFAEIKSASDEVDTFNGFCGAESGSVPVSATAPGILVRRIETQKQYNPTAGIESPVLSRPQQNN